MNKAYLLRYLVFFVFFSSFISYPLYALTDTVRAEAYAAYNPYKDSFRFFWHNLGHEQKIALKKSLLTHIHHYLMSKLENHTVLGKKRISLGLLFCTIVPIVSTFFTTALILYLKDYNIAPITIRSSIAATCACSMLTAILYGLKKIYTGFIYKKRVNNRIKRDETLLEKIEVYEKELI